MNSVKHIYIKNHAYYFFDDMINIKNLDPKETKNYTNIFTKKYFCLLHWIINDQRS